MWHHIREKILAYILIVSLLLSIIPYAGAATAVEANASVDSETAMRLPEEIPASTNSLLPSQAETVTELTKNSQILAYIDETVLAEKGHVTRLPELETLSSYAFLNNDGTATVYYMDKEVKYIDNAGKIVEKNIGLTSTSKGYSTISNDVRLVLPHNPANGVGISYSGYDITLTPQGGALRTPAQNNGTSICYADYFGPGTLLVYTPTLSGVKEDIVLAHYTGINTFSFRLETDGLNLYLENERYYLAESEEAEMRIEMGDIVSFDAFGKFSIGTLTTETVTVGDEYILTITVDEDFLVDENTVYPVSIDPTLTVSDNTHGAGAIEDVSIYSGRPSTNGNWTYLHCGYYDNTYQVARTLFRLTGLTADTTYQSVSASQILSAEFHIYEASGSPALPVRLYANTGSASWTESGATWNNAGVTYGTSYYATASPASNTKASYNITSLLKDWKNNSNTTVSAAKGFVLVSTNEATADKAFYSAEFASTSYRPYVVVNYQLGSETKHLREGGMITLSSAGITGTITWASTNTAVAKVSSTGTVTGLKAGKTEVTASVGGVVQKTFTIYVAIADGVYFIKNLASSNYLSVKESGIGSGTKVVQTGKMAGFPLQFSQLWKITYLYNGKYSIRPMHKLNMCLDTTGSTVQIFTAGNANDTSALYSYCQWGINYSSNGYVFKHMDDASKTVSTSGTEVVVGTPASITNAHRWSLENKTSTITDQIIFYNAKTKSLSTNAACYVAPAEVRTQADVGIYASFVSKNTNVQSIEWSSADTTRVSVNANNGTITGQTPGTTTIEAEYTFGGTTYKRNYTVHITEIPEGTYNLHNKGSKNYADIENQTMVNGTYIHQGAYHGGNSQKWIFTHCGDGTYTIKSANSTTNYYLGVKDDSTANNAAIVLRTGTITNGMKWIVEKTSAGAYKLIPKTGEANNRVLALAADLLNVYIQQRDFGDDANYRDEWHICLPVDVGMSTENYTDGCSYGGLQSYLYATNFYNVFDVALGTGMSTKTHHYNMGSNRTASKNDFSQNGAISNSIDFMIYMGHGLEGKDSKGNFLHYNSSEDGTTHTTDHSNSQYNAYILDINFGSSTSDLRWVWLYTCNALTTKENAHVSDDALKERMTGAHIVMGYASQSKLGDVVARTFAQYLGEGKPIINAYFDVGYDAERTITTDNHIYKVMYIPQAVNETIYTPYAYYEYEADDVIVVERGIYDESY